MNRPRLRNVSKVPFFSTEVTWKELKSDVDTFLPKKVASTIIRTECFFHLSGFFVTLNMLSYLKLGVSNAGNQN